MLLIWCSSTLDVWEGETYLQFVEPGDFSELVIHKLEIPESKVEAIKYLRTRMAQHGLRCMAAGEDFIVDYLFA